MVASVTYVTVGTEAPTYVIKMLHSMHIYFIHN
jgi:hypothetical protein